MFGSLIVHNFATSPTIPPHIRHTFPIVRVIGRTALVIRTYKGDEQVLLAALGPAYAADVRYDRCYVVVTFFSTSLPLSLAGMPLTIQSGGGVPLSLVSKNCCIRIAQSFWLARPEMP